MKYWELFYRSTHVPALLRISQGDCPLYETESGLVNMVSLVRHNMIGAVSQVAKPKTNRYFAARDRAMANPVSLPTG
jgi:hypothetical protein